MFFCRQEILAQNRYNDWGTLKYSLRSVDKFAPWIRTIHLVTDGQIPYWLDLNNRRINIIAHKVCFCVIFKYVSSYLLNVCKEDVGLIPKVSTFGPLF